MKKILVWLTAPLWLPIAIIVFPILMMWVWPTNR